MYTLTHTLTEQDRHHGSSGGYYGGRDGGGGYGRRGSSDYNQGRQYDRRVSAEQRGSDFG